MVIHHLLEVCIDNQSIFNKNQFHIFLVFSNKGLLEGGLSKYTSTELNLKINLYIIKINYV